MKNITLLFAFCCLWSIYSLRAQVTGDILPITSQILKMQGIEKFEEINLFKFKSTDNIIGIGQYHTLEIDKAALSRLFEKKYTAIALHIPVSNLEEITVHLIPSEILADDFKTTYTGNSESGNFNFSRGLYYKGIILNSKSNSIAVVSIYENEISGVICDQSGNWNLGKINQKENAYGFYNDRTFQLPLKYPCNTEFLHHVESEVIDHPANKMVGTSKCVKIFFDCDFDFYTFKGNSTTSVVQYVTNLFNIVSTIYGNESVSVSISEIHVWTTQDPYSSSSSSAALGNFTSQYPTVNGNVGHLLSHDPGGLGGIANLNALCNGHGYSDIDANYTSGQFSFPTYTWDAMVVTHELGHNFGSPHTHDCAWNGNNTAIDGCGPTAGYASSPGGCSTAALPGMGGGTIMSYCHLLGTVGINLANGFGIKPGDKIRTQISNTACVNACLNTCLPYVSVGNPVNSFNYGQFTASNILWANSYIDVNATADFSATSLMILNPGFIAYDGSTFHGVIGSCSPQPVANNFENNKTGSDYAQPGSQQVFPNPCHGYLDLYLAGSEEISTVMIFDMKGEIIFTGNYQKSMHDARVRLNTENLVPGIYYLETTSGKGKSRIKFIKI